MNPKQRRVRSKSPQDMFKEFNKSKLQRLSKNFGRDSLDQNQLEMERKFRAVRLNKYKPQKFNNNYYLLMISILGIILLFLIFNSLSFFQKEKQIIYCSQDLDNSIECQPCPFNTECEGGKIIQCPIGTFLQDNECVSEENIEVLKKKMKDSLKYKLQYLKGDSICQQKSNKAFMKISQIESYLKNEYKGDQYLEDALREFLFDIRYDSKYQNLFESQYDNLNSYDQLIQAKEAKFRISCSFSMTLQRYKWLLLSALACLVFVGLMYLRAKMNKKYVRIAERVYQENLQKFNEGLNEIDSTQILNADKDNLKPSERNKVMDILERIRRKDEQFTIVEKHGIVYWVKI